MSLVVIIQRVESKALSARPPPPTPPPSPTLPLSEDNIIQHISEDRFLDVSEAGLENCTEPFCLSQEQRGLKAAGRGNAGEGGPSS